MILALLLIACTISSVLHGLCYGQTIINVANGGYSTKLRVKVFIYQVPLHRCSYQSTIFKYFIFCICQLPNNCCISSSGHFWSKLQISRDDDGLTNAGSLVYYGNQAYKTATGYWMDNLEPGHYTFEVQYTTNRLVVFQWQLGQIIKQQYYK